MRVDISCTDFTTFILLHCRKLQISLQLTGRDISVSWRQISFIIWHSTLAVMASLETFVTRSGQMGPSRTNVWFGIARYPISSKRISAPIRLADISCWQNPEYILITLYSFRHGFVNRLFAYWLIASNPIAALYAEKSSNFAIEFSSTLTVGGRKNFCSCGMLHKCWKIKSSNFCLSSIFCIHSSASRNAQCTFVISFQSALKISFSS